MCCWDSDYFELKTTLPRYRGEFQRVQCVHATFPFFLILLKWRTLILTWPETSQTVVELIFVGLLQGFVVSGFSGCFVICH